MRLLSVLSKLTSIATPAVNVDQKLDSDTEICQITVEECIAVSGSNEPELQVGTGRPP